MKIWITILAVVLIAILTSCDVQSDITKKSVEKYLPTPTPSISPTPTEIPIDPADVVNVDTTIEGKPISINNAGDKKPVTCTQFNQVMVNSSDSVITIKGKCRQIMINGHGNKITVDATAEIVINGDDNEIKYWRFVNGKRPRVTENRPGSVVEKISASPTR